MTETIKLYRLGNIHVDLPHYKTSGSAGLDLQAAITEPMTLAVGERRLVPAGFAMALPRGYEAQVRPRSGLALKDGVTVLNSPGTIDSDYRGPVGVILVNLGNAPYTIQPLDRIAQMVIAPVTQAVLEFTQEALDETERGSGGFGSTGVSSGAPLTATSPEASEKT